MNDLHEMGARQCGTKFLVRTLREAITDLHDMGAAPLLQSDNGRHILVRGEDEGGDTGWKASRNGGDALFG